jgi:xylulokinase
LFLAGGGAEQRPVDWWSAVVQAVHAVLGRKAAPVERIAAVSCTSQYSTTVAIGRDGQPLANAISWMDTRGAPHVQRMIRGWLNYQGYGVSKLWHWIRLTGGAPTRSGKDSLAHILYLKYERPDIYGETYQFLEPKDYLNLRLTGRYAATYDSITLHWLTDNRDIHHIRYWPWPAWIAPSCPNCCPRQPYWAR